MHKTFPTCYPLHFNRLHLAAILLFGVAACGLSGRIVSADACATPTNGPTGPDAAAFTYQCDGEYAGEWTNSYYVYDPSTSSESPLYTTTYSYDCTTNTWTQNEWDYDSTTSAYVEDWVPAATAPNRPTGCPTTTQTTPTTASSSSPTPVGATILNNTQNSGTQSGSATVSNNGSAGNATTGDATSETTDTNLIGTTDSTTGGGVTTFTSNVDSWDGNLVIDPSNLPSNTGTDETATAQNSTDTNSSITNTITATAVSGDATVAGNGDAGDATSGNTQAIVNLINMINSAVASGQSFIGTINIYGDLNGNILVPQSVIDQLLAANGVSSSSLGLSTDANESIINNVNASAQSGDATVANNSGAAGNAATGTANTNVTILNLTGSSVIGQNVLLVFVNVLGQWVGMIVNAPAGSTSAEFGGGVMNNIPSTNSSVTQADANLSITNNVTASAKSGSASVVNNTNAGNASSGSANTAVNILNVENSDLALANWFGILFINVFGTWDGNFGILSSAVESSANTTPNNPSSTIQKVAAYTTPAFAAFVPLENTQPNESSDDNTVSAVLGDSTIASTAQKLQDKLATTESGSRTSFELPILGASAAAVLLLISERDRIFRRN